MTLLQKHECMMIHQEQPLNAGCPVEMLRKQFVTPQEYFFVRNHGTIPTVCADEYRLSVQGLVQMPLELSVEQIKGYLSHSVMATLQCAGSRRDELNAVKPIPGELLWGAEPISNAFWRGARLRDVLEQAGVTGEAQHVAFVGLDDVEREGKHFGFGSSIPLDKAMIEDVILAYEMNDEPLAPIHGFPLRVVVPGYIGARSVKWLKSIIVQAQPSANYFQAHAYKLFPPHTTAATVNWNEGEMLGKLEVHAVICQPRADETLSAGMVTINGYAITGDGSLIACVELSTDNGSTWTPAWLLPQEHPWAWCFWEAVLPLQPGKQQIIVRACDGSGKAQPEDVMQVWNFKGYMNNAWHRVHVHVIA